MTLARLASETGVLPSVALWGLEALEDRTDWHVAFDLLVMQKLWRRQREEIDEQRRKNGLGPSGHHIRGARGTGRNLPTPIRVD